LERLFSLEGQTAVVAGGAGRIGRALCHALAGAGARVVVLDLAAEPAQALAAELIRDHGRPAIAVTADTTERDSLEQALADIEVRSGRPSILINACQFRGRGFYSSEVDQQERAAWDQVLATNLTGTFLACQVFGGAMAHAQGGVIVNLASTYGVVSPDPRIYGTSGVNSPAAYGASKAGVIQLTRYLAVHWREQRVRVNCLVPGGVFDQQSPEFVEEYCRRTPLGRMAAAEDYQAPILFLTSPAASYLTGSVLTVDGGWTAW